MSTSIAKQLSGNVTKQLNARASAGPSSAWKTRKKVWATFYGTDKKTISTFENKYSNGLPPPGITGIEVKFKGSLGSLREVTVNYQCWSKSDLGAMSKSFMQLGRSCAIVFGWSIRANGKRVTGTPDIVGNSMRSAQNYAKQWSQGENVEGCGAAYKGIVDNFSFSLNADGSYSCMTHFITAGEAALDMDTDLSTDGEVCLDATGMLTSGEKNTNLIQGVKSAITATLTEPKSGADGMRGYITIEREQTEEEKEKRSWWQSARAFFGESMFQMDTVFLSWKWCEDVLFPNYLFPETSAGNPVYRIDSTAKITSDAAVFCADPLVGHIPGHSALDAGKAAGIKINGDLFKHAGTKLETVRDVWFNANWMIEQIKTSEKLQDLIQKLLDGVNRLSGNRWELVVIVNPDNPNELQIVDAGMVEAKDADGKVISATELKMYGDSSVATNVTLDTSVPNGIKAAILYGANAEDGKGGNKESGEFRFQPGTDELTTSLPKKMPKNACGEADTNPFKTDKIAFEDALDDLFGGVEQTTVDKVFQAYYDSNEDAKKALEADGDGEDVLIPLNFSFDVEGIEGFQYGALITGNHLPGVYKSKGHFMVTSVGHKVDANNWTTSIETIFRRK